MKTKFKTGYLPALLGIFIGILLSMIVFRVVMRYGKVRAGTENWRKLTLILHEVQKNYVDSVDVNKVTDAAVEGALAALDPHSIYMPPAELKKTQTELEGNFDGIGIQFNVPNDTAVIMDVIPGGPSEKAGLQQGDRIIKVGTKDIAGVKFPQDSIVSNIKGPAGTKVKIIVDRDGLLIPFNITRGKFHFTA
jgi:carboxyl-terminal processing protease